MGVYIGAVKDDYSALQGPAPDGFHVPLNTERKAVKDIRKALGGGNGTNFGIALKLPFAGCRDYSSADVNYQGSRGYYWSSSRYNAHYAYFLRFSSATLYPQDNDRRAYGLSVRCFKNSPVIPTSSWTKLYGTSIEAGGIFWSSTDGLISLSSNGQTWITIADKNLGATTVWNNGDTLSEANCGKYYQWGNNYGFPRTGTIANQSTTQVDASSYGPGNYYSSDTFIKYSGRWDTTDNGNLRGGVTGLMPTSLKNAYIGEVYEYSLDFRSKTTSQLTTEGWSIPSGVSIDSSKGIYSSSSGACILSSLSGLNSALQNAKKITITMTKQSNSGNGKEAGFMIIYTTSTLRNTGIYTDTGVSSGFQISCGGTNVYTAYDSSGTGKYTITTVYDLVSKKVSINYPGLYNTEASITDSQITNMKTSQGLRVKVTDSYIQDISILIE